MMISYDVAGTGPALVLLHSTVCDRRMWDPQWPVLVVSGAKDLPDFRLIAARLAALLPAARLVELSWAGHLPTLERPQELSGMLTVFLRETAPVG